MKKNILSILILILLSACANITNDSQTEISDKDTDTIKVMILGSYHFGNPGQDVVNIDADDVLNVERQRELEALNLALATFNPNKIAIEQESNMPDLKWERFSEFNASDLKTKRNEIIQIALRLAHHLEHKTMYAIDEQASDGEPNYFPYSDVIETAESLRQMHKIDAHIAEVKFRNNKIMDAQSVKTIPAILLEFNKDSYIFESQEGYYNYLDIGDTSNQSGAELNAYWYMRNAKIFSKLNTIAKPGDRIVVLFGAGHNYWLRHFVAHKKEYEFISPTPYLKKAIKNL